MRVSMKWYEEDSVIQGSCDNFGYGEVEDYTVNITQETTTPICEIAEITAGQQSDCEPSSNTYEQQISVSYNCTEAETIGIYINDEYLGEVAAAGSPTTLSITGLVADGDPVDVRAEVCQNGQSVCPDLNATALFTAPAACDQAQGEPCVTYPSERSADDITTTSATINWSAAADASFYQVRVRVRLSGYWSSWYYFDYSYENQLSIIGLIANTRYQFRIRTRCPQGWTRWSPNQSFTTPSGLSGDNNLQNNTQVPVLTYGEITVTPTQIFQFFSTRRSTGS